MINNSMDNSKRKERTTLFVGDLSSVCTEADLESAFSNFGQVQQVRIQRNRMTMASMAYGFVRMTNPVESINAKNALDGTLLCGRKLRVREAEYGVGGADKGFLRKYSLYIKFESTEEGKKTNEVKIRDIFSQYGEVSDISLRKIFFDKHTGLQKGYGFIHFSNSSEGIQASFNVIADIPQINVDGVVYVIEASNNLKSRIDAIVQDTPEAADELSDAKAFIMNSGNGGRNGNQNSNMHYGRSNGHSGNYKMHRNKNNYYQDDYDDNAHDAMMMNDGGGHGSGSDDWSNQSMNMNYGGYNQGGGGMNKQRYHQNGHGHNGNGYYNGNYQGGHQMMNGNDSNTGMYNGSNGMNSPNSGNGSGGNTNMNNNTSGGGSSGNTAPGAGGSQLDPHSKPFTSSTQYSQSMNMQSNGYSGNQQNYRNFGPMNGNNGNYNGYQQDYMYNGNGGNGNGNGGGYHGNQGFNGQGDMNYPQYGSVNGPGQQGQQSHGDMNYDYRSGGGNNQGGYYGYDGGQGQGQGQFMYDGRNNQGQNSSNTGGGGGGNGNGMNGFVPMRSTSIGSNSISNSNSNSNSVVNSPPSNMTLSGSLNSNQSGRTYSADGWLGQQNLPSLAGSNPDSSSVLEKSNFSDKHSTPSTSLSSSLTTGGLNDWSKQPISRSAHGSFDGSPSLRPSLVSGLQLESLSGSGKVPGYHDVRRSSMSSTDEEEIARMLGNLDPASTLQRATSNSSRSTASSVLLNQFSGDSYLFGSSSHKSSFDSVIQSMDAGVLINDD